MWKHPESFRSKVSLLPFLNYCIVLLIVFLLLNTYQQKVSASITIDPAKTFKIYDYFEGQDREIVMYATGPGTSCSIVSYQGTLTASRCTMSNDQVTITLATSDVTKFGKLGVRVDGGTEYIFLVVEQLTITPDARPSSQDAEFTLVTVPPISSTELNLILSGAKLVSKNPALSSEVISGGKFVVRSATLLPAINPLAESQPNVKSVDFDLEYQQVPYPITTTAKFYGATDTSVSIVPDLAETQALTRFQILSQAALFPRTESVKVRNSISKVFDGLFFRGTELVFEGALDAQTIEYSFDEFKYESIPGGVSLYKINPQGTSRSYSRQSSCDVFGFSNVSISVDFSTNPNNAILRKYTPQMRIIDSTFKRDISCSWSSTNNVMDCPCVPIWDLNAFLPQEFRYGISFNGQSWTEITKESIIYKKHSDYKFQPQAMRQGDSFSNITLTKLDDYVSLSSSIQYDYQLVLERGDKKKTQLFEVNALNEAVVPDILDGAQSLFCSDIVTAFTCEVDIYIQLKPKGTTNFDRRAKLITKHKFYIYKDFTRTDVKYSPTQLQHPNLNRVMHLTIANSKHRFAQNDAHSFKISNGQTEFNVSGIYKNNSAIEFSCNFETLFLPLVNLTRLDVSFSQNNGSSYTTLYTLDMYDPSFFYDKITINGTEGEFRTEPIRNDLVMTFDGYDTPHTDARIRFVLKNNLVNLFSDPCIYRDGNINCKSPDMIVTGLSLPNIMNVDITLNGNDFFRIDTPMNFTESSVPVIIQTSPREMPLNPYYDILQRRSTMHFSVKGITSKAAHARIYLENNWIYKGKNYSEIGQEYLEDNNSDNEATYLVDPWVLLNKIMKMVGEGNSTKPSNSTSGNSTVSSFSTFSASETLADDLSKLEENSPEKMEFLREINKQQFKLKLLRKSPITQEILTESAPHNMEFYIHPYIYNVTKQVGDSEVEVTNENPLKAFGSETIFIYSDFEAQRSQTLNFKLGAITALNDCIREVRGGKIVARCITPGHPDELNKRIQIGYNQHHYNVYQRPIKVAACPAGQTSDRYQIPCQFCQPGTYKPDEGFFKCILCEKFNYNNATGQDSCLPCPIFTEAPRGASTIEQCVCKKDYFFPKYRKPGQACVECPENAICNGNTTLPMAKQGFWFDKEQTEVNNYRIYVFTQCRRPEYCPETFVDENGEIQNRCRDGHTGLLCDKCDTNYYNSNGFCKICENDVRFRFILIIVGVIILVFFVFKFAQLKVTHLSSISIAMSYFQLIAVFSSYDFKWPPELKEALSVIKFFNFDFDIFVPECISEITWGMKYGLTLAMPLAFLGILVLFFVLELIRTLISLVIRKIVKDKFDRYLKINRSKWILKQLTTTRRDIVAFFVKPKDIHEIYEFFNKLIHAFVVIISFSYVFIITKAVQPFDCDSFDGKRVIGAHRDQECYVGYWWIYFSVSLAVILLFGVGMLIFFGLILFRKNSMLKSKPFNDRFRFLFVRFRKDRLWWELTIVLRKLLISLAVIFFSNFSMLVVLFTMFITFVAFVLQTHHVPFRRPMHNFMEFIVLLSTEFLLFCGLLFYVDDFPEAWTRTALGYLCIFVVFACAAANILLIAIDFYQQMREDRYAKIALRNMKEELIKAKDEEEKGDADGGTKKAEAKKQETNVEGIAEVDETNNADIDESRIDDTSSVAGSTTTFDAADLVEQAIQRAQNRADKFAHNDDSTLDSENDLSTDVSTDTTDMMDSEIENEKEEEKKKNVKTHKKNKGRRRRKEEPLAVRLERQRQLGNLTDMHMNDIQLMKKEELQNLEVEPDNFIDKWIDFNDKIATKILIVYNYIHSFFIVKDDDDEKDIEKGEEEKDVELKDRTDMSASAVSITPSTPATPAPEASKNEKDSNSSSDEVLRNSQED